MINKFTFLKNIKNNTLYMTHFLIFSANIGFTVYFFFASKTMFIINLCCLILQAFSFKLLNDNKNITFLKIFLPLIYFYMVASVLILSWEAGFQLWLFAFTCAYFLPFYTNKNDKIPRKFKFLISIIFITTFCILYFISPRILTFREFLPRNELLILYSLNSYLTSISIVLACYTFVSQSINARNKLKTRSDYDELTSLPNRYAIEEALDNEIALKGRNNIFLAIIDIDYFKKVNDTYGHLAGDEALKYLANILNNQSKNNGVFAGRWGGEEFIILSSSVTKEEFYNIIENIRIEVSNSTIKYNDDVINITISVGIAEYESIDTIDTFIKKADDNLYKAKKEGRNKIIQ